MLGGGGSRADLNGALKRESFASSEFEAQIHPPVANCHTEYEIPPPPHTYVKVAMPLSFPTVTPSWLCRPSLVLEDELSTSFLISSCRVSRNFPLLCQFAVYFQYGIGQDLRALPSKRSSISAFNPLNTELNPICQ